MLFNPVLEQGILERRYKRFIADVCLDGGEKVRAHCPNTGPMTGIAAPGMRVALSCHKDAQRKLPYTWEMTQVDSGQWVGMNTQRPNKLFHEAFKERRLDFFKPYVDIQSEVTVGTSRFDFLVSQDDGKTCYVEVKNAHMKRGDGVFFPDTVRTRGAKHVRALTEMVQGGQPAALVYIVQRNDCSFLSVAHDIDPDYGACFLQALDVGVSCLAYACTVTPQGVCIHRSLPVQRRC